MLGIIVNEKEVKELEYLIKRELEEILFELDDKRIGHHIKRSMEERYKILFRLFKRVAPENECMKYILPSKKRKNN